MNTIAFILGVGIVVAGVVLIGHYISSIFNFQFTNGKIGKVMKVIFSHFILKMMFATFALGLLALIPLTLNQDKNFCQVVMNSSSATVNGSLTTTTYTYVNNCINNPAPSSTYFLHNYVRILWFFGTYVMIFLVFMIIDYWASLSQQIRWR